MVFAKYSFKFKRNNFINLCVVSGDGYSCTQIKHFICWSTTGAWSATLPPLLKSTTVKKMKMVSFMLCMPHRKHLVKFNLHCDMLLYIGSKFTCWEVIGVNKTLRSVHKTQDFMKIRFTFFVDVGHWLHNAYTLFYFDSWLYMFLFWGTGWW